MASGQIPEAGRVDVDNPPFSRVFVVCSKKHTQDELTTAFHSFGEIEDVWVVKDKLTKENRGVCYIKYAKASSAAVAIEQMDGKIIGDDPKPIKVGIELVASIANYVWQLQLRVHTYRKIHSSLAY